MKSENKPLVISMIFNSILIVIKIVFGMLAKSKTLVADGIHSLSDLVTDIVAIVGNVISNRPADDEHPYGHGQIQYLTSIIVGVFIFALGILLIIGAFSKTNDDPSIIIVLVSIITITIKWLVSAYLLKMGKKQNNSILMASGHESRADALTSIFVIFSFAFSKLTDYIEIFKYSDSFFTIVIGVYILFVSYKILRENFVCIIGTKETDETYLDNIKYIIKSEKKVLGVNKITAIKYGTYYIADIEIQLDRNLKLKDIERVNNRLRKSLCNHKTRINKVNINITWR